MDLYFTGFSQQYIFQYSEDNWEMNMQVLLN